MCVFQKHVNLAGSANMGPQLCVPAVAALLQDEHLESQEAQPAVLPIGQCSQFKSVGSNATHIAVHLVLQFGTHSRSFAEQAGFPTEGSVQPAPHNAAWACCNIHGQYKAAAAKTCKAHPSLFIKTSLCSSSLKLAPELSLCCITTPTPVR